MAEAKYEILIPGDSQNAFNDVTSEIPGATAHVEQRNVSMMGAQGLYDVIVFLAEDVPETDSKAKQIAANAAILANVASILVSKQGKQGIQTWPVRNPNSREPAV